MKRSLVLLALIALLGGLTTLSAADVSAIFDQTGIKGGLVVHIGCKDGKRTTALRKNDSFMVFGLSRNADNARAAREHIQAVGLSGKVTVDLLTGRQLPLIDNVVNLLVAEGEAGVDANEILRVLAPGGVAFVNGKRLVKPVPEETDEWTHYLHGPDNNAVSRDKQVSYPYHMQWAGYPIWTRHHNFLNSYSAVVSAGGRVFYILDEGPTQSIQHAPQWKLVARDAYNGVVLWKRDIPQWEGHMRRFRTGPVEIARRLVASGDRVYVTLGYGEPLSIMDAATGELLHTAEGTEGTHEIVLSDKVLYLVAGELDPDAYEASLFKRTGHPLVQQKRIIAVRADTGKTIWEVSSENTHSLMASTLCVDKKRLYFQSPDSLVCLNAETGAVVWKSPRPIALNRATWSSPTLVVHDDVVLSADGAFSEKKKKKAPAKKEAPASGLRWTVTASPDSSEGGELIAYRARDGKELWRCPAAFGYTSPPNLFVIDNLVWVNKQPGINETDMTEGRDLHTGEVKRELDTARAFEAAHHHRCYRDKATERFFLLGRTGVEYVDVHSNDIQRHYWIRGTCQYGLMPANGLLYLPGHSCACYIQSKLSGFWAIASKRNETKTADPMRLIKGEAYGKAADAESTETGDAWPMHRGDNSRSGSTNTHVPKDLKQIWSNDMGGELTPPVIADQSVVVALKERHTVVSLDASDGRKQWSFTCGGRIDSPPTISNGLVVFGSHDGHVYCLRSSDGRLVWKYLAAFEDKRTMAFGQLESVWPVVGSVSVLDDTVYCVSGRSSYLDGGMVLRRLDLKTGAEKGKTVLYSRDPKTGEQPDELLEDVELPGALPDILVFEGDSMFLRDRQFDLEGQEKPGQYKNHLYSSAGLLDPSWWHRTHWIWGERAWGRAAGWAIAAQYNPSGSLLVLDGPLVYGYKPRGHRRHWLFCSDKKVEKVNKKLRNKNAAIREHVTPDKVINHWKVDIDFAVRGMVKAADHLIAAGPLGGLVLFDASAASTLAVFSADEGKLLSKVEIPCQPVFDGMVAVDKRVYMSLVDGQVVCYGGT